MSTTCSEMVPAETWGFRLCQRRPTVERDGKPYCMIHDPVRVAERRKAREEKWNAERAATLAGIDAAKARERHRDHCEAVHAEMLAALRGALNWLPSYSGGGAENAYNKVRDAIAKAEGGTQ